MRVFVVSIVLLCYCLLLLLLILHNLFFKAFAWREASTFANGGGLRPPNPPRGREITNHFDSNVSFSGRGGGVVKEVATVTAVELRFENKISNLGSRLNRIPNLSSNLGSNLGGMVHHSSAKGGLRRGGFSKGA